MERLAKKIIEVRNRNKLIPDHFGAVKLDRLYDGLYMDSITTEVYFPNSKGCFFM